MTRSSYHMRRGCISSGSKGTKLSNYIIHDDWIKMQDVGRIARQLLPNLTGFVMELMLK